MLVMMMYAICAHVMMSYTFPCHPVPCSSLPLPPLSSLPARPSSPHPPVSRQHPASIEPQIASDIQRLRDTGRLVESPVGPRWSSMRHKLPNPPSVFTTDLFLQRARNPQPPLCLYSRPAMEMMHDPPFSFAKCRHTLSHFGSVRVLIHKRTQH